MVSTKTERPHRRAFFAHPLSLGLGILLGAVLALVFARGSGPINHTFTQSAALVPGQQDAPAEPSDAVCAEQTWPYIERGCAGRIGAAPHKRLVRVIAPDRLRTPGLVVPQAAPTVPPAADTVGSGTDVQSAPLAEPPEDYLRADPDRSFRTRPMRQKARPRVAHGPEQRAVVVLALPGRAGIVAEGPNYRVRRVYLLPRDDGVN